MSMKLGASEAAEVNDARLVARNAVRVNSLSRVVRFM